MADKGGHLAELTVVSWSSSLDDAPALLDSVIQFSKRFKATVGFLPDAAFIDRAEAGTLVVARDGERLVGYLLYSRSRSALRLTHVCVDPQLLRSGIAKRMLNEVIGKNPHATGVVADCRRDYGLDRFWAGLGFSSRGERPGRGKDGHPLARWWRPLGGPDLFDSLVESTELPLAVLDANVVIDLCADEKVARPYREASRALEADWLVVVPTDVVISVA